MTDAHRDPQTPATDFGRLADALESATSEPRSVFAEHVVISVALRRMLVAALREREATQAPDARLVEARRRVEAIPQAMSDGYPNAYGWELWRGALRGIAGELWHAASGSPEHPAAPRWYHDAEATDCWETETRCAGHASGETCPGCHGRRWADDENWQPDDPRHVRTPGDGLIPCGFCNFAGWDTPLVSEATRGQSDGGEA